MTEGPAAGAPGDGRAPGLDGGSRRGRRVAIDDAPEVSLRSWEQTPEHVARHMGKNVAVEFGWGRLLFGQTFVDHESLFAMLREEAPGRRDVCMYLRDPHVLVSRWPDQLFLDPSLTYRLRLHRYRPAREPNRRVQIRALREPRDADDINRVWAACDMVTAPVDVVWDNQRTQTFDYFVAVEEATGEVVGTVTGVDHVHAFNDPEGGTSLWSLAVHPQNAARGTGEALVRFLAERYQARGRSYIDLSVMHDNRPAIRLYEKLGFERVPVFTVKRKNPINERLFSAAPDQQWDQLNPYAKIIAEEARRRGIAVTVLDPEGGYLLLSRAAREIDTRESLSELTSAVAMSRCDDKEATRRVLTKAGLRVARGTMATTPEADAAFLDEVGELVVKPVRGEQGRGITVGVTTVDELRDAVELARRSCPEVLLEELVEGDDLRIVVIDHQVVAAAVRRPATVVGDGERTVRQLIEDRSARRQAATGGESTIPVDEVTEATVRAHGHTLDDVLGPDEVLRVRRTANLHTGGTIHDVTEVIHPELARVAIEASRALDIPVVGMDLLVPDVEGTEYVIIEANERPGLANHEPQPTAARFIDLLFPGTQSVPSGWEPDRRDAVDGPLR